jgi:hypothetical protein
MNSITWSTPSVIFLISSSKSKISLDLLKQPEGGELTLGLVVDNVETLVVVGQFL